MRTWWLNKNILLWIIASCICTFGDVFTTTAIPMLTYSITRSARFTALVYCCDILPEVLFLPIVGVMVDRYSKKLVIISSCIAAGVVLLSLMLTSNPWVYLLGNSLLSFINLFYSIAVRSSLAYITDDTTVRYKVNSLISFVLKIARVGGVSAAAMALLFLKVNKLLLVDSFTFFVTAAIVYMVCFKETKELKEAGCRVLGNITVKKCEGKENNLKEKSKLRLGFKVMGRELRQTVNLLRKEKAFLYATLCYISYFMLEALVGAQLIVFIERDLGKEAFYYAIFQNLLLAGVLLGQFTFHALGLVGKELLTIKLGLLGVLVSLIAIVTFKAFYIAILFGAFQPFVYTSWYAYMYKVFPRETLGRVLSLCSVCFAIARILSSLFVLATCNLISTRVSMGGVGLVILVLLLLNWNLKEKGLGE